MIVIPLLALIVPIAIFIGDHKNKTISFEILSESTVADVTSPLGAKIQVLYDGKKLKNLKTIFIRIINSGNVSIKKTDFEKDLQLLFGKNVRVLASRVDYAYPNNLSVKPIVKDDRVLVSPLLLNPKDEFTIESLVTGETDKIGIDARIEGITRTEITKHGHLLTATKKLRLLAGLICLFIYLYSALLLIELLRIKNEPKIILIRPLEILFVLIAAALSSVVLMKEVIKGMDMSVYVVIPFVILAAIGTALLKYFTRGIRFKV